MAEQENIVIRGLEVGLNVVGTGLAKTQIGLDKILWGSVNDTPNNKPKTNTTTVFPNPPIGNPLQSGVIPVLNVLNQVELCSVINYILGNINLLEQEEGKALTTAQRNLKNIQTKAAQVADAIDNYYAAPTTFLMNGFSTVSGSVIPTTQENATTTSSPETIATAAQTNQEGSSATNQDLVGTNQQKWNLKILMDYVVQTLSTGTVDGKPYLEPEDYQTLSEISGLNTQLNGVNSLLPFFDRYTDVRNIQNSDVQKILERIDQLRFLCRAIQGLNSVQSFLTFSDQFLGTDIQSQINKIQKYLNPNKILPTIDKCLTQVRKFERIGIEYLSKVTTIQFYIKIAVLLLKIFKFIIAFLAKLPLPNIFTTVGVNQTIANVNTKLQTIADGLVKILKMVNSLIGLFVRFGVYLVENANTIGQQLQVLKANISSCEDTLSIDSTIDSLEQLKQRVNALLANYNNSTNSVEQTFQQFTIRVIEEEVQDRTVRNRRRRGVAFDSSGIKVVESDLTFATDNQVIIEETKIKLIANKFALPELSLISTSELTAVLRSLTFLEEGDISLNDFSADIGVDVGLGDFVKGLKGGRTLRRRTRRRMDQAGRAVEAQVKAEQQRANISIQNTIKAKKQTMEPLEESVTATQTQTPAIQPPTRSSTFVPPTPITGSTIVVRGPGRGR